MSLMTISLAEDRMTQLREVATRFRLSPEDLVRLSIDEMLARPDQDFKNALDFVLAKNELLYQRLA